MFFQHLGALGRAAVRGEPNRNSRQDRTEPTSIDSVRVTAQQTAVVVVVVDEQLVSSEQGARGS